jgi:hypothetical protein
MTTLYICYGIFFAGMIAAAILAHLHNSDVEARFWEDCRRKGMTVAETLEALSCRVAFVELRDAASALCIEQGGEITRSQIDRGAEILARGIAAAHGEQAGKAFVAWVARCPLSEVLYNDARDLIVQRAKEQVAAMPPVDKAHAALVRRALTIHK